MKQGKKWLKILALGSLLILLAACTNTEPISAESTGLWDGYVIFNLSRFLVWLADLFGGSYAAGIVVFTVIIRTLLIPLYKMQMDSMQKLQEIQPELDAIQAKYPNKDRESREKVQQEQAQLIEDRGVNQFAGCLPLLIQLPVMVALYQAILRTEALRQGDFLWMNLGQPDPYYILPILAGVLTYYNSYLTTKANPQSNASSKIMTYTMPVMIFLIALGLPGAVALYWVTSNAFTLFQTLVFNNPYKVIAEREAKEAAEKERNRQLRRQLRRVTGKKKK